MTSKTDRLKLKSSHVLVSFTLSTSEYQLWQSWVDQRHVTGVRFLYADNIFRLGCTLYILCLLYKLLCASSLNNNFIDYIVHSMLVLVSGLWDIIWRVQDTFLWWQWYDYTFCHINLIVPCMCAFSIDWELGFRMKNFCHGNSAEVFIHRCDE